MNTCITEKVCGITLTIVPSTESATTSTLTCLDAKEIQDKIDIILNKHPTWTVASLDFKYKEGFLLGSVHFTIPKRDEKKLKRFRVTWREHEICESVVMARSKREAKRIAMENFPDSRDYEVSTDWEITEEKKGS